ncbi:hypothetical protein SAMN03159488_04514 [Pseudomonas sp. NFIX10]|nr:hypothetical protein SAMN03159488_04514 [Pseudomonas sp. NFIX10]SFF31860.1 hypothetical protein SAMN03159367_03962 [Pseudomonas sp. NFACC06-1]
MIYTHVLKVGGAGSPLDSCPELIRCKAAIAELPPYHLKLSSERLHLKDCSWPVAAIQKGQLTAKS